MHGHSSMHNPVHDLDLSSVGKTNQFYSESEELLIRQSMSQKEDDLAHIKRDIARLVEVERTLEADLTRYKIALSPQKRFPDEVLSRIFVIAAEEHGPVVYPIQRGTSAPPQLVLSYICSRWRMLALHTSVLWSSFQCNVHNAARLRCELLDRARNSPVTLYLTSSYRESGVAVAGMVQQVASSLKAKILHLHLTCSQFAELSQSHNTVLPDIETLHLALPSEDLGKTYTTVPGILVRLWSVNLFDSTYSKINADTLLQRIPPFPWNQLRRLCFPRLCGRSLGAIIDILQQTSMLLELQIGIILSTGYSLGSSKQVIMPCLRKIEASDASVNELLRRFICPALTAVYLHTKSQLTFETYGIIKRQYNLEGLQMFVFSGWFTLPVSSILKDAPMLCALSLPQGASMDDRAITGISNASLGRNLKLLYIDQFCHTDQILEMVEARKRMADELIEKGCNWREAISTLNDVLVIGKCSRADEQRIEVLGKSGIKIRIRDL